MLMAGLDGVENKIHPGEAATKDLYHLPPEEDAKIPTVCHSLDQALEYLDKGRGFLTKGGVFTDTMIDAYIELKMQEVTRFRMTTHPIEFDMYYSPVRRNAACECASRAVSQLWQKDGLWRPFLFEIKGLFGFFEGLRDTAEPSCAFRCAGASQ